MGVHVELDREGRIPLCCGRRHRHQRRSCEYLSRRHQLPVRRILICLSAQKLPPPFGGGSFFCDRCEARGRCDIATVARRGPFRVCQETTSRQLSGRECVPLAPFRRLADLVFCCHGYRASREVPAKGAVFVTVRLSVRRRASIMKATATMHSPTPMPSQIASWWGKGLLRAVLLLAAAAAVAAVASNFGIARDYGYLRASLLTGSPGGEYYALGRRLAERAERDHGVLIVIPTEGSIENVSRLTSGQRRCAEMFALVQDGTPVSADARLELLGRLPAPETLCFSGGETAPSPPSVICADHRLGSAPRFGDSVPHASTLRGPGPAGAGYSHVAPRIGRPSPTGGTAAISISL